MSAIIIIVILSVLITLSPTGAKPIEDEGEAEDSKVFEPNNASEGEEGWDRSKEVTHARNFRQQEVEARHLPL